MAMKVAVDYQLAFKHEPLDHLTRAESGRKGLLQQGLVVSVDVATGERTSVVANDDTVWVEHRDYFEDEVVAQELRSQIDRNVSWQGDSGSNLPLHQAKCPAESPTGPSSSTTNWSRPGAPAPSQPRLSSTDSLRWSPTGWSQSTS